MFEPSFVSEIVRDPYGGLFDLRPARGRTTMMHVSVRQRLDQLRSINTVLDNKDNRGPMARALAEVNVLAHTTAESESFENIRARTARALVEGVLELVPYVRTLRPMIDQSVVEPRELDELDESAVEELHAPTKSFIEVQVLYEDGRPYGDCQITVAVPGESRRNATLDGEAKVRFDDIPGGVTCVVTFPQTLPLPDPEAEPLIPPDPEGDLVVISRRSPDLVPLVAGKAHRIVIRRARVRLLQMEDVHFQVGRAVLLPDGEPLGDGDQGGPGVTSLSVAAAVLQFARDNPEQRVLIAGHTDTTGSETFNADLSEARAINVQLYLAGDGDGWAAHCADNAAYQDAQRALRWAALHFGWPCDPGPVDDLWGKRSKAGLRAFRIRFSDQTGGSAGDGDTMQVDDWRAFFDLYDLELGKLLGEGEDPAAWRDALTFVDPATLACGESWPEDAVGLDDYPCAQNRRVDALFFDEEEIPPDLGDLDPPGKSIYGDPIYVLEPLDVHPHDRPDHRVYFELALGLGDDTEDLEGASLTLTADGYELVVALDDAIGLGGGLHAFRFYGVHQGTPYTLTFEAPNQRSVVLFEELPLDAFLGGIGNHETAIEPLAVGLIPFEEPDDDGTSAVDHGPMHPESSLAELAASRELEGLV